MQHPWLFYRSIFLRAVAGKILNKFNYRSFFVAKTTILRRFRVHFCSKLQILVEDGLGYASTIKRRGNVFVSRINSCGIHPKICIKFSCSINIYHIMYSAFITNMIIEWLSVFCSCCNLMNYYCLRIDIQRVFNRLCLNDLHDYIVTSCNYRLPRICNSLRNIYFDWI